MARVSLMARVSQRVPPSTPFSIFCSRGFAIRALYFQMLLSFFSISQCFFPISKSLFLYHPSQFHSPIFLFLIRTFLFSFNKCLFFTKKCFFFSYHAFLSVTIFNFSLNMPFWQSLIAFFTLSMPFCQSLISYFFPNKLELIIGNGSKWKKWKFMEDRNAERLQKFQKLL